MQLQKKAGIKRAKNRQDRPATLLGGLHRLKPLMKIGSSVPPNLGDRSSVPHIWEIELGRSKFYLPHLG